MDAWQQVCIGDILTKTDEWIDIAPDQKYKQVTVRLWGKGVVLRIEADGSQIAATRQRRVRSGQFILSRIDARNGAFGLVPDDLDGAVVSNDFPSFGVNRERLLPSFLDWMSKTKDFVQLCVAASEGTTNRVRLQEDRFLAMEIPLPPLAEQQRIVARIEALAARIEEAKGLRAGAMGEVEALWVLGLNNSYMPEVGLPSNEPTADAQTLLIEQEHRYKSKSVASYNGAHPHRPKRFFNGLYELPKEWTWTDIGSVLSHLVDCVNDTPNFAGTTTDFIGLKSSNIRPYKLELSQCWYVTKEDFLYWNRREQPLQGDIILTREAPIGNACILPDAIDVCLTQRLLLLRPSEAILPRYLLHYINSQHFQRQILDLSRGLTTPHIRVKDAPNFLIPLAPINEQRRIVAYLDDLQVKVEAVKRLQAETQAELAALLPAVLDRAFRGEL